jgi:hypothetical protein
MAEPEFVSAVAPVVGALEGIGVAYYVTGSVVSSRFGVGRSTLDVDIVADLREEHAAALETALRDAFYVELDAVADAIRRRSMFNVVHLATMIKVDVYTTAGAFDRAALDRGRLDSFSAEPGARRMVIATPEDVVVHKLSWYRAGGEVSERQWGDVVGVLRVQAGRLDLEHMRRWARELGVEDLLQTAMSHAND